MAAVAADPGSHVFLPCLREEAGIVEFCLWKLPHVIQFVDHKQAEPVAQIQKTGRGRIMGSADGIGTHRFHQKKLPRSRLFMKGGTECTQVMMEADSLQFQVFPVQKESLVRSESRFAEAHVKRYLLHRCAA